MPLEPAPTAMQNEVVVHDAVEECTVDRVRRKADRLDAPRGAVPLQGDGSARAAARATDSLAKGGARAGHAVEAGPVRAWNGRSRHQGPGGSVPLLHEDRTGARHGRIAHGDAERRRHARDADERVRCGADHRRQGHRRPGGPVPELRVGQEAGWGSKRRKDARRGAARDRDAEHRRHAGHGAGHRTGRRRGRCVRHGAPVRRADLRRHCQAVRRGCLGAARAEERQRHERRRDAGREDPYWCSHDYLRSS